MHLPQWCMVYNAVRAIMYRMPVGLTISLGSSDIFTVISSSFIDAWTCNVELRSSNGALITTAMPQIGQEIISIPRDPGRTDLVYLDQEELLPPSIRQLMPTSVSDKDLLLGKREWMKDPNHVQSLPPDQVREITPKKHYEMIQAMKRAELIFRFVSWLGGNQSVPELDADSSLAIMLLRDMIEYDKINRDGRLRTNVQEYQRDSLRYWNECYDQASELIFFPICPRQEMTNEEAMLAAIQFMEDLGFIDKVGDDDYKLADNATKRYVFQYGDVLTIQKWYTLGYHILRKMTHIGREEYVTILMTAYDRFIYCGFN